MTNHTAPAERAGHSSISQGAERAHTLIIQVENRPGAVDRVVGVLRRRRANMQTLVLAPGERENVVRITVTVNDAEVGVAHLVEQLRKVVDVQQVVNLAEQQVVARELALIKVNGSAANFNEIIQRAQSFGAHAIDITHETVTLEVAGSEEQVEKLVSQLEAYGIREVARSGRVAIARDN